LRSSANLNGIERTRAAEVNSLAKSKNARNYTSPTWTRSLRMPRIGLSCSYTL
jgi:hypothetical protein